MPSLTVKELMTPEPFIVPPTDTIQNAAQRMKEVNCGFLPVGAEENIIGIITDRDIALRAVAEGRDPARTSVRDIMTREVHTCEEGDDAEAAAHLMQSKNICRLVVTKNGRTTGVVTLKSLLRKPADEAMRAHLLNALVGDGGGAETQRVH